ncbi:CoA transferase [Arthrobacter alkaliphilus]|uniref:CoA transferase n=1 Tax=Arthrobacter alkaliphilus TaxID=369936 RepID=UPI001F2B0929|nr:CoA transferase [Arthrobacter alkaliphilus]
MNDSFADVASRLWHATGADDADWPDAEPTITGPRAVLPAAFDVTGLATGAVAVATTAAAQFLTARRRSGPRTVTVDSRQSCAAFASERLFTPIGWSRPPLWDPIAGNYRASDAWIRLHTNYASHRAAVERVLGAYDRETVQTAVARFSAEELEAAIVAAGGCAAVMHSRAQWLASAPGAATADAPPLTVVERRSPGTGTPNAVGQLPFDGVRVLDLTRVIAGPVCTKFLAGYGADVLRIDPPGFEEVPSLLPETTLGKRTAALDLTTATDRATFEELLASADVLVSGLRADALERVGYDDETLTAASPALIIASLDAYGWDGPWRNRRGFDSLVQMSCGIADDGATATGQGEPAPLPVQALDHATGWLMAGAVARALSRRLTHSVTARIKGSLIGTANLLYSLAPPSEYLPLPTPDDFALTATTTYWGPARRAPLPGRIDGVTAHWSQPAGPLGRHPAAWATP